MSFLGFTRRYFLHKNVYKAAGAYSIVEEFRRNFVMNSKTDLNTHLLISKQVELGEFNDALREVTGENAKIFVRMLQRHMEHTEDRAILKTVKENTQTLLKSLNVLVNSKQLISNYTDVESLTAILKAIEEYFNKHGLETDLASVLRKAYLKIHEVLKKLDTPTTELTDDPTDANTTYLQHYHKYLNENISRVNQGFSIKDKPSDWNIDSNSERGTLQTLALEDSLRHIKTGLDYSKSRGDLRYQFGTKPKAELHDEFLASVCNKMLDNKREELINKIKWLEGIQEENLSEEDILVNQIVARAKRNKQ